MAYPWSVYKTWTTGEILTAADLNSSFSTVVSNTIPANMDDYSGTVATMQSTADPYPGGSESLASTLAGELERLRYVIAQITGETNWYVDPDSTIAAIVGSTQTFAGAKTFSTAVTISATTNQLVLGTTNTTTITSPAPSASRTYTIPDAGGAANFLLTGYAQTVLGSAGSASAPGVAVGDTANGMYRSDTNEVSFATNGTQRLKIESDGDIFGTTSGSRMAVKNTYNNINVMSVGAIDSSATQDITIQDSKTFTVTWRSGTQIFGIEVGDDARLVVTNSGTSTITILGTGSGHIVASSTPSSTQLGIFKSAGTNLISFKSGSALTGVQGVMFIQSLSGPITAATDWA